MTSPDVNSNAATEPNDIVVQGTAKDVREMFEGWGRDELVEYSVKMTQAFSEEKEAVQRLTTRYDATQNWALGMALVEEIGHNLASTLEVKEVLRRLMTRVYTAIDVEDGSVLLIEEPSGDLVSQVVLGALSDDNKPFRVPRGQGIAGEVALSGAPVIVNDTNNDPRHFKKIDTDTGFLTQSLMCVPILTHERIIGVLEVVNKKSGPFTEHDQFLLSSLANYAGIAIENARLHEDVIEDRDRVIRAQEQVSHRLQRDLHDGPTQLVAAIQMNIEFCQKAIQHNELDMARTELDHMLELAMRASHQMRTLLFELRPLVLETKGLVAALETFVERRQAEDDHVKLHLKIKSDQVKGDNISRLDGKVEAALFAIVQEAVNNALKYAEANHILVRLDEVEDKLHLAIFDDGKGFDVESVIQDYEERGSYGMVNLRERVAVAQGDYTLKSEIGKGTELQVIVPVSVNLPESSESDT